MREIILDGQVIKDVEDCHKSLKDQLDLPDYYGGNLDALWDILSPFSEKIVVKILNYDLLVENLDSYGEALLYLFYDLEEENQNIEIRVD